MNCRTNVRLAFHLPSGFGIGLSFTRHLPQRLTTLTRDDMVETGLPTNEQHVRVVWPDV
jgi:hypothetical protein